MYSCYSCNFIGKDKYALDRHYESDKHKDTINLPIDKTHRYIEKAGIKDCKKMLQNIDKIGENYRPLIEKRIETIRKHYTYKNQKFNLKSLNNEDDEAYFEKIQQWFKDKEEKVVVNNEEKVVVINEEKVEVNVKTQTDTLGLNLEKDYEIVEVIVKYNKRK